jgi:hypothetical protein
MCLKLSQKPTRSLDKGNGPYSISNENISRATFLKVMEVPLDMATNDL